MRDPFLHGDVAGKAQEVILSRQLVFFLKKTILIYIIDS